MMVVKGIGIDIDPPTLGRIIKMPCEGVLEDLARERETRIEAILKIKNGEGLDKFKANSLMVEMRLHHIVSKITIPRNRSFNVVTKRDLSVMYHIVSEILLNLPNLMIKLMKEAVGISKVALSYGMILTHVFKSFRVNL